MVRQRRLETDPAVRDRAAAVDGGGASHRACADPDPGNSGRQPRPCRPRGGASGDRAAPSKAGSWCAGLEASAPSRPTSSSSGRSPRRSSRESCSSQCEIEPPPAGTGWAFREVARTPRRVRARRRRGAACTSATTAASTYAGWPCLGVGSVAHVPDWLDGMAVGEAPDESLFRRIGERVAERGRPVRRRPRLGGLPPAGRGRADRPRPRGGRPAQQREGGLMTRGVSMTVNGRPHRGRRRASARSWPTSCARTRTSTARISAASTACAAPARFCSTGEPVRSLPDARRAGRRRRAHDGRGTGAGTTACTRCRRRSASTTPSSAASARRASCSPRSTCSGSTPASTTRTRSARRSRGTCAAAPATRTSSTPCATPPGACGRTHRSTKG